MLQLQNLDRFHDDIDSLDDLDFLSEARFVDYSNTVILGYLRITASEHKRLDKVAKDIYGQHGFLEQIMEFNGILNANNVIEDDIVAIPDIASMQDNEEVRQYQNKFIEQNVTSFSFDGNIIIGGQTRTPNRKISTKKNFKVDRQNGVIVF